MNTHLQHIQTVLAEADLLFDEVDVNRALHRLAAQITDLVKDENPILLCVLTGGIYLTGQLLSRLQFALQLDYVHATRYKGQTVGGGMDWVAKPTIDMSNRTVVIVDDILDEGTTLVALQEFCKAQGAKSIHSAVLVEKRHDRKTLGANATFVGLEVDDRYVFGAGMDYKDYLRNLPGIYAVKGS